MKIIKLAKVIQSRRKTLSLEIGSDAKIVLRIPLQCPETLIEEFILSRADWILKTQQYAVAHCKQVPPKTYLPGERFLYLGKEYQLVSVEKANNRFGFDGKCFWIQADRIHEAPELFRRWYLRQAQLIIKKRADLYTSITKISYNRICITHAKQRSGSCNPVGNLNFTSTLVMAPLRVIDCVVVHELIHLEIRGHRHGFWERVKEFIPENDECRAWLNKNQNLLSL
jgi:predicted metal-dependent hydrolase